MKIIKKYILVFIFILACITPILATFLFFRNYIKKLTVELHRLQEEIKYYKTREKQFVEFKKKRNINDIFISNTAIKFIIKDLEGGTLENKKVFNGCGGYLSIGPEYVLRYNDLNNKGIFFQAGYDIKDYLSKDFIKFLKKSYKGSLLKKNRSLIKIKDKDFIYWKNQNALLKSFSIDDGYILFKTIIKNKIKTLRKNIKIKLNQWQYDALIMAIYNLGGTNLINSDFFKYLNKKKFLEASYILATIRNSRYNKNYPKVWKNGKIANTKIINFVDLYQKTQNTLKKLLNDSMSHTIKIDYKIIQKYVKNKKSCYLKNLLPKKLLMVGISTKSSIIFNDELKKILQIKENEINEFKFLFKKFKYASIYKFICNLFLLVKKKMKSTLGYDCYIWNKNQISLHNLINEIINIRKITSYAYGWIKRDFLQSNIFLKTLCFNAKLTNIFSREKSLNNLVQKFWYILAKGKHKNWIFDKKHDEYKNYLGIKILYLKYFQNLEKEFHQKNFKY